MKVAIVILNWNGEQMLRTYLPTVLKYSRAEADTYVADNASTDGSMRLLADQFPEVKTILLDRNYGFAEGYNRALAQIDDDCYVLLNSDVEVTPHWLTPLIALMERDSEVAACQPKLLAEFQKDHFEYAGAAGGFLDRYGYPFCRGRVFEEVEADHGQYDQPADVLWATGACLMIRAQDYWQVHGFDYRFFAHNEEIDLCWRLRQRGRRIMCEPSSHVFHVGGGTLPKGNPMKTFLNFRNNLTMLYKNLPAGELVRVMAARWVLDHVAALQTLLVNHNWGDFVAILRARRAFWKWRHDFDDDRNEIRRTRVAAPIAERKPYSILWLYYIKGIRKFSLFG